MLGGDWKDLVKFSVYALSYIRGHTNFEPIIVGIKRKISPTPFVLLIKKVLSKKCGYQIAYHHSFCWKQLFESTMVKFLDFVLFFQRSFAALKAGLGICSIAIWVIRSFLWAKEQKSIRSWKRAIASVSFLSWAYDRSFVKSDRSESLTITLLFRATWVIRSQSLFKKERLSEERRERFPLWHKKRGQLSKHPKNKICKKKIWANCLFLRVKRAIWVICSRSLFCHERPER